MSAIFLCIEQDSEGSQNSADWSIVISLSNFLRNKNNSGLPENSEILSFYSNFFPWFQDLQSDIFGGGATKKFWNMYKGSTSYDSFDESDTEAIEELKGDSDEELLRISKEYQDPEDDPYRERQIKKGKTVIVAYKPSKSKMNEIYDEVKNALKSQKIEKITDLLSEITDKKESRRESQSNDYEEDEYTGEAQHEKRSNLVEKEWKVFAKKVIDSTPDPVVSIKHTIAKNSIYSKESIKIR